MLSKNSTFTITQGNVPMIKVFFILLILLHSTVSILHAEEVFLDEQFSSLERWEPFYFPKIEKHSSYNAGTIDGISCLIATSNNSAWANKKQSKQFIPNAYSKYCSGLSSSFW